MGLPRRANWTNNSVSLEMSKNGIGVKVTEKGGTLQTISTNTSSSFRYTTTSVDSSWTNANANVYANTVSNRSIQINLDSALLSNYELADRRRVISEQIASQITEAVNNNSERDGDD